MFNMQLSVLKNTYKKLKNDPSKKLQRKLNEKLWLLHLANIIKKPLYSQLRSMFLGLMLCPRKVSRKRLS